MAAPITDLIVIQVQIGPDDEPTRPVEEIMGDILDARIEGVVSLRAGYADGFGKIVQVGSSVG